MPDTVYFESSVVYASPRPVILNLWDIWSGTNILGYFLLRPLFVSAICTLHCCGTLNETVNIRHGVGGNLGTYLSKVLLGLR